MTRKAITRQDLHITLPVRDLMELKLFLPVDASGNVKRHALSAHFERLNREWLNKLATQKTPISEPQP